MHKTIFPGFTLLPALLLGALIQSGCASQPQKPRERYSGTDTVESVAPQMLVGNWRVRMLNPTDSERDSWSNSEIKSVASIHENGTLVSTIKSDPLALEVQTEGTWTLSEGHVTMAATSSKNVSDNPLSVMVAGFLTSFREQMNGSVNIYEASADRLVMVNEAEGTALEYIRLH